MTFTRREFLLSTSAAMASLSLAQATVSATTPPPGEEPSLVFAHLTDMHIKPSGEGPAGLARCLHHVQSHPDKPAFILNGGDAIMSSLGATAESTEEQWKTLQAIWREENSLRLVHCIGNHDCWGWQRSKAGTTGDEPRYGKVWAMEELKLEKTYFSFDEGGWRIIVLDSVQERGDGGYLPMLDDEQFAWLEQTLDSTSADTHVIIVSHVPILSVTPMFFFEDIVKDYQFHLAGALMQQDMQKIVYSLRKYEQVRLCISGHAHLVDEVVYEGKSYLCNGAVCGSWWHGVHKGCPPGYAIMKLWRNGAFSREYITYDPVT